MRPGPSRTALRELGDEVQLAVVDDRVHGIEAQAVEAILLQPVERVVDEEVAHGAAVLAVEVDRRAPRRVMTVGEELRRVRVQLVAFRAEVVVDHVEQHRSPRACAASTRAFRSSGVP